MGQREGRQGRRDYVLSGVRVVEVAGEIPAAYCGHLLALLGADVIRVEVPQDASRTGPYPARIPSAERSALYRFLHARKKSLSIDVSTATGRSIVARLVGRDGVLLVDEHGTGGGYPQGLGTAIREASPRAVVAEFTPWGVDGPYSSYASVHLTSLAASGWLHTGGQAGREPLQPGSAMAEYGIGIIGAFGVTLALLAQQRQGIGQQVDVAAIESLLSLLAFPTARFAYAGDGLGRLGDRFPFAIFPCVDGYIGVNILTKGHWTGLCGLMGQPDLLTDPRFETGEARQHPDAAAALGEIIGAWAATQEAHVVFHKGQQMRVPISIIPSPREVLESPHYAERAYWVDYEDDVIGRPMRLPGAPFKFSSGRLAPFTPAPRPGGDTAEVLTAAGYTLDEFNTIAAARVYP